MSSHIANDLPRLLNGEAGRDEVLTAAGHLRTCVDCQHELISAVVAHASLSSAYRFAPEIVSGLSDDLSDGAFTERDADAQVDDARSDNADSDGTRSDIAAADLPDLSAVFAEVRREAAEPRPARPGRRVRYLAAAAAVVVVAGGAAAIGYAAASGNGSSAGNRTVQLSAFDKGDTTATATMSGDDEMRIDAAGLPQLTGKRYEVWLTNGARSSMQPVGWLGTDDQADMTVPSALLRKFDHIEISVQPIDAASYDYSGTSVLRGDYA